MLLAQLALRDLPVPRAKQEQLACRAATEEMVADLKSQLLPPVEGGPLPPGDYWDKATPMMVDTTCNSGTAHGNFGQVRTSSSADEIYAKTTGLPLPVRVAEPATSSSSTSGSVMYEFGRLLVNDSVDGCD